MTQQAFNDTLDHLANTICKKYYYKDEDLRAKVFNKTYDELNHNLEGFDRVEFSFTPHKNLRLNVKIEIISKNQIIQTIKFTL